MFIVPLLFVAMICAPFVFPKVFFKEESVSKNRLLFYNVTKDSENPFLDEKVSVSLYDPDAQLFFAVEDVHDEESYKELCVLLNKLSQKYDNVFMVTYDIENREMAFKLSMELFLDETKKFKFMDIKRLFYCIHPNVPKVMYNDILEYYNIPKMESKALEYCVVFDNVAKDFHMDYKTENGKLHALYKQMCVGLV